MNQRWMRLNVHIFIVFDEGKWGSWAHTADQNRIGEGYLDLAKCVCMWVKDKLRENWKRLHGSLTHLPGNFNFLLWMCGVSQFSKFYRLPRLIEFNFWLENFKIFSVSE